MTVVILFVLGTIVGSFLNVVGLRWGTLLGIGGRSSCPNCNRQLKWWELFPIISFFILKAKCRGCKAGISWLYPLVELWTGLIFVSLFYIFGFSIYYLLSAVIFCIYVIITIYDLKHKIIPDLLVYLAIILSFGVRVLFVWDLGFVIWDFAAGMIIFLFFASIWYSSGGRAMGFGDAKLGLSVGLLLGAVEGFSAIILAFWIGALSSLLYLFLDKNGFLKNAKELTMKSEIPFAPFIILGAWISLVFHLDILHVASF